MAGTSKSLIEVGISMVLKDGFSQQAGKISDSYRTLLNDMNMWNRALTNSAGNAFDYGTKLIGGMYEAYKHSATVSNEIFMTSKIAGATAEQSKALMQVAQEVNMQTPLTNLDIASGERFLAMAGNSAEAIQSMIGPAAKLASIFDMQLGGKGGVADMMTNIMATFGHAAKDADYVADVLGVATTSANMNLRDLAQALQYSGSTFRNAGIDLRTAAAAIGVLGDQGIQASSAGTALANMVRYLTLSVTGQKQKGATMLKAMGITREDLVDANGNLRDLATLMDVLASKMGRLSGTAREAAMYNIFGVRGQRAASGLFQAIWNGSDKMRSIINSEDNSSGWVDRITEERLKTPQGRIDALNASIDNLKVSIGQAATIFTPLITAISKVANFVAKISSNDGIGSWVVKLGACMALSFTLVNGARLLLGVYRMITTMSAALTQQTTASNRGMSMMNTQAAMLEAHLRTIVALMTEYVALSYAPGTTSRKGMVLPMGGRLGRAKNGKPYISMNGKRMNTANYALGLAPAAAGAASGAASGAAGAAASAASTGLGLGSMLAFMAGGPWGIGIGLGLTALSMGLDYYMNSVDSNTEAVKANTEQLSAQEVQAAYNERYIQAIKDAIRAGGTNTKSLNLTINGTNYGDVRDGDTVNTDTYNLYY